MEILTPAPFILCCLAHTCSGNGSDWSPALSSFPAPSVHGGRAVAKPDKHVENSAGKSHLLKGHTYFHTCTVYLHRIVGISKANGQLASAPPSSLFTPVRRRLYVFLEANLMGLWAPSPRGRRAGGELWEGYREAELVEKRESPDQVTGGGAGLQGSGCCTPGEAEPQLGTDPKPRPGTEVARPLPL